MHQRFGWVLKYPVSIHMQDAICFRQRFLPVSRMDDGDAKFPDCLQYMPLIGGIKVTGGFVQQEKGRAPVERSGQHDALPLPTG